MTLGPTVVGRMPPLDPDQELEHETQDECGDGDHDQGDHQDGGVEDASAADPGDDAGRDSEDRFEDQRHERELDRDGECVGHDVGNGLAREGLTEVQGEDPLEVEQVLHTTGACRGCTPLGSAQRLRH